MEIRIESLLSSAAAVTGTAVVIDVFRAFTVAAVVLSKGARQIIMVDSIADAIRLRNEGLGDVCIGERNSQKPVDFNFGNSPAQLMAVNLTGKSVIQTTSNGTAGVSAAKGATTVYAASLVNAEATVQAILGRAPPVVTLLAMGRSGGSIRTDEDEICALYLRSRLEGRTPDKESLKRLLLSMVPPVRQELFLQKDYDAKDRTLALDVDSIPIAMQLYQEGDLMLARPQFS